jgi:3-deoxy-7-phosphoheptulonate synthase
VHPNPDHALKDGAQSITIESYEALMPDLVHVAQAVGRTMADELSIFGR